MTSPISNQPSHFRDRLRRLTSFLQPAGRPGPENTPQGEGGGGTCVSECSGSAAGTMPDNDSPPEKKNAETSLVKATRKLSKLVVLFARDSRDHPVASKFDVPHAHWRGLRGDSLLQWARGLLAECGRILHRDAAWAGLYGITPEAIYAFRIALANYEKFLTPQPPPAN